MSWVQLQKQQISRTLGSTLDLWKRPHSLLSHGNFFTFILLQGDQGFNPTSQLWWITDAKDEGLEVESLKSWGTNHETAGAICCNKKSLRNYFTSSDPHHDMLGGGCQVRDVIKNMMGRMENLRTLISGFLGLVILVRWALVTMFLSWNYSDRLPHPSDLCQPWSGQGEGRHTTHLLKCVLLLSTSQTDWSNLLTFFLTYLLTFFLTYLSTCFLTYLLTFFLTYQNQNLTSTAFTQKAALQTLYLPHTTQQK